MRDVPTIIFLTIFAGVSTAFAGDCPHCGSHFGRHFHVQDPPRAPVVRSIAVRDVPRPRAEVDPEKRIEQLEKEVEKLRELLEKASEILLRQSVQMKLQAPDAAHPGDIDAPPIPPIDEDPGASKRRNSPQLLPIPG